MLALTTAPVVNPPAAVLATGRSNNAKRFSRAAGSGDAHYRYRCRESNSPIRMRPARWPATASIFLFFCARPAFTPGQHFLRVESFEALPAALAELPGEELIVMQYLDARGADGKTRKYRAMMIDGQIYPLHLAISSHWKIHYFTAEMADNPEHRAEDAAFLENMPSVLGPARHERARTDSVRARTGLWRN